MQKQANRLVLVLMALALMVSPLRSSWAMPAQASDDTSPHCAQMQGDVMSSATAVSANDSGNSPDKQCNGCCDDDCNHMNCNACAHAATAISASLAVLSAVPATQLDTLFIDRYSGRTVIPPLRPPASL